MPVFGICLGHQLLATALGGETYKLPVRPPRRQPPGAPTSRPAQVEITSQNHNFAVDRRTRSAAGVEVTHVNLNDGVDRGPARAATCPPSACSTTPRPARARTTPRYLFDDFADLMDGAPRALMPRRDDIESILLIGSGPIVIGQACEFDYSGTQACRVLREEGYRVILANSNPATIMTDPDFADATYVEPLDAEHPRPASSSGSGPTPLLPTLGGQTALNLAMELVERGRRSTEHGVELIGANAEAIATAEDRERFKAGDDRDRPRRARRRPPPTPWTRPARSSSAIGLPVVIRPAYILGGRGTGIATTPEEFERVAATGLDASPISEILIEQSIAGWKEYELEVMRDRADNCVIVCSIENVDPMGVHTGDSITVAPAQTLSDVEYQRMRDAAFACIRRVGVETGGSNVQFALDPADGDMVVIEMNPRVSRSSALASKATGFPIAKIAARLAVGYTLDEIPNDITEKTPASFEPTIDYVVTKIPRWAFEKFPGTPGVLGTQMQSVGEAMAIGRTFPESLQKGAALARARPPRA